MSHTPPVPEANQSPYPIQEPPHAPAAARLPPVASANGGDDDGARLAEWVEPIADRLRDLPLLAIGAALGLGAALVGGLVFGVRRGEAKPRKRKRGDR